MLKIPTTELNILIDSVLEKRQWTQTRLAQELNTYPEKVSRWKAGVKIEEAYYKELLRLKADHQDRPVETVNQPLKIPFSFTIPRASLRASMDANGDINVSGEILALIDKKEK